MDHGIQLNRKRSAKSQSKNLLVCTEKRGRGRERDENKGEEEEGEEEENMRRKGTAGNTKDIGGSESHIIRM